MTGARWWPRPRPCPPLRALAVAVAATLPAWLAATPVQAAEWAAQGGLQARVRVNQERADGQPSAAPAIRESRLVGTLNASRSLENSATRLDGSLDLPLGGQAGGNSVQGRLVLGQSLTTPRDTLGFTLERSADDNQPDQRSASDALLGPRRRNSSGFSASWQRALTPRWSAQADANTGHTTFSGSALAPAQAEAQAFRNSQASATLSYQWDELLRLSLQASRSRYAQDKGSSASTSDNLRLSANRALSERSSLGFSLGGYQSLQQGQRSSLACPLPVSFCNAGLVAPVLVVEPVASRSTGSQYSLNLQSSLDERTATTLSASRQLSPSGAGVVQADNLAATLNLALLPELNLAFNASHSRSRTPGAGGNTAARPSLTSLEATLNWNLQENLSLSAGVTARRFQEVGTGSGSRSAQFSISLQYQAPRILATR